MGKQTFDKIKKTVTILLAIFIVATLTATSVSAKTVDVSIQGFAFKPASVQVSAGDTVKWTNKDTTEHTVTGSTFDSGRLPAYRSYSYTFTKPGTYDYACSIHPSMKGTVVVNKKK